MKPGCDLRRSLLPKFSPSFLLPQFQARHEPCKEGEMEGFACVPGTLRAGKGRAGQGRTGEGLFLQELTAVGKALILSVSSQALHSTWQQGSLGGFQPFLLWYRSSPTPCHALSFSNHPALSKHRSPWPAKEPVLYPKHSCDIGQKPGGGHAGAHSRA